MSTRGGKGGGAQTARERAPRESTNPNGSPKAAAAKGAQDHLAALRAQDAELAQQEAHAEARYTSIAERMAGAQGGIADRVSMLLDRAETNLLSIQDQRASLRGQIEQAQHAVVAAARTGAIRAPEGGAAKPASTVSARTARLAATKTPSSEQRLATLNRRAGTLISAMGADLRYTPAQRAQAQNALARLTAEQERIRSQSATTRQSRSGRISELKQQIKDYQRGVKSNQRDLAKLQREMDRLFSRRRYNGRSGESISRDMRHIEDNLAIQSAYISGRQTELARLQAQQ